MSWDRSLWGWLAGSNVYCASTDPVDLCPKAEPREQRGLTLYTLASRLQKQKAKLNPHMAACDFIGYFISLVLMWSSRFNSLSFISLLCHPLPSRCQNTVCVRMIFSFKRYSKLETPCQTQDKFDQMSGCPPKSRWHRKLITVIALPSSGLWRFPSGFCRVIVLSAYSPWVISPSLMIL
jgi:hypothetical protein